MWNLKNALEDFLRVWHKPLRGVKNEQHKFCQSQSSKLKVIMIFDLSHSCECIIIDALW